MNFKYPKHVRFECNRCTLCCGDTKDRIRTILLLRLEADRIARKTLKSIEEFAESAEGFEPYVYKMKKTAEGKCVFLKDSACTVYDVRPLICRFYPFELKDVWKGRYVFACTDECPCVGEGPELSREHFEKLFAESKKLMRENASKA